jgi:glycosyltransferase involved in cell wall biosynthesis
MKISVITPSYNSGNYLEEAIQSVLRQNYSNFEHIIVDGSSTDKTIDILKKYDHIIWVSEEDRGQSHAMNKGFEMSSGEIIVYLNADDYFEDDIFNSVVRHFEQGCDFLVGNVLIFSEKGWHLNQPKTSTKEMLYWWLGAFSCNPVGYFYRKSIQEKVGGYNENNHLAMDYEFLMASSLICEFKKIEKTFGVFRHLPGTKTRENQSIEQQLKNVSFLNNYINLLDDNEKGSYIIQRNNFCKRFRERNEKKLKERNERQQGVIAALFKDLILEKASNIINKHEETILYGAGRHTKWLLQMLYNKDVDLLTKIVAIMDDAPKGSSIYGIPIYTINSCETNRKQAVIISSDTHNKVMSNKLKELYKDRINSFDLYEGYNLKPIPKT